MNYLNEFSKISQLIANEDWLLMSIKAKNDFINNLLSYDQLIDEYGNRSDNDYEIMAPRWKELSPESLHKSEIYVKNSFQTKSIQNNLTNDEPLIEKQIINKKYLILKDLLLVRSKTRKVVLYHFSKLRSSLISNYGDEIENLEIDLLKNNLSQAGFSIRKLQKIDSGIKLTSGKGSPASKGTVTGSIIKIKKNTDIVEPGMIGIFPNPGTAFTNLYNQCSGIIFLSGGAMSHGCIVAREFGIPAIVDNNARFLENGQPVQIHGDTGEWKIM